MSTVSIQYSLLKTDDRRRSVLSSGRASVSASRVLSHDLILTSGQSYTFTDVAYIMTRVDNSVSMVLTIPTTQNPPVIVAGTMLVFPFRCTVTFTNTPASNGQPAVPDARLIGVTIPA